MSKPCNCCGAYHRRDVQCPIKCKPGDAERKAAEARRVTEEYVKRMRKIREEVRAITVTWDEFVYGCTQIYLYFHAKRRQIQLEVFM